MNTEVIFYVTLMMVTCNTHLHSVSVCSKLQLDMAWGKCCGFKQGKSVDE